MKEAKGLGLFAAILSGVIFPWLVYGSLKVFGHDTEIAVIKKEAISVFKTLGRMELKIDKLDDRLRQIQGD